MPDVAPWNAARTFEGDALREVAFPLGGIGTGTVSLGGRGNLQDWEVFGHPSKGCFLPYTFFSLWARPEGREPVARVLERRFLPPYIDNRRGSGGFGLSTALVSGLPRLREARFTGAYPLARIVFADEALPLQVSLEAFNPFIPMDDRSSGMPVAVFAWTLANDTPAPVDATLCFSLLNPIGFDGRASLSNRHHSAFGSNLNELVRDGGLTGLRMTGGRPSPDDPVFGSLAVTTDEPLVTWRTRWERAGWWDDVQSFWDDFRDDGRLPDGPEPEPSPGGQTDVGSLGATLSVAPGEARTVRFVLAWHFPNMENDWNHEPAVRGRRWRNWYATQWPDAWAVASEAHARMAELESGTREFARTLFESTLPAAVVDAASANASIMRTTTCLRTEDGRFHGFEGCGNDVGCCPMNCTHVWNYEQALAFLFPSLERTVRSTDFEHNTRPDGNMAFRTLLPLVGELWAHRPAADGQMGTVMKAYREWLQAGDRDALARAWPGIQRAVEFAWAPGSWDADRDGVMEGEQHNTYDIEFYGPNTMCGTLYLGALRAAEELARVLGADEKAAAYREVFERGRKGYTAALWNGEFYGQVVRTDIWRDKLAAAGDSGDDDEPRYQHGPGCLSDQLLGQWFARVVGLGDLLEPEQVRSALGAIVRNNWRTDLGAHESVQRVYAVNDESGLLLCTWPRGGRPRYPFPYADEVWTGIEYQVASHCIYEGLVDEGVAIVEGLRNRHDGARRNPWDEFECGHHYARAMASWALILACSGYHYDAAAGRLSFAPRVNAEAFRCVFTSGTAWGSYAQSISGNALTASVEPRWGSVTLQSLGLPFSGRATVSAEAGGGPVPARAEGGAIVFERPVTLVAGQALKVTVQHVP